MLTNELISELVKMGFSKAYITKVIECFDLIMQNYNVSKKESNIVAYDSFNSNQKLYDIYFNSRKFQGYAKGTLNNIKIWLGKFIEYLPCSVIDVLPMHVRLFLAKCSVKRNGKPMANSSIEKIKQIISSFYGWLINERIATYNPASNIQGMKTPFKYQGALTSEEVAKLKFACEDDRERMMVEFLVSTGCRIAEFVNIKLKDINMQQQSVKVLGKGNKERVIYLNKACVNAIKDYLSVRPKEGIDYKMAEIFNLIPEAKGEYVDFNNVSYWHYDSEGNVEIWGE